MDQEEPRPIKTAFVSGPVEPEAGYFAEHYESRVRDAIAAGHHFVMGPAPGIDTEALEFLLAEGVAPERITVFVTPYEARMTEMYGVQARAAGVEVKVAEGHAASERDAQMTASSDYDILRYRTAAEARELYGECFTPGHVTATERNERRRQGPLEEKEREEERLEERMKPAEARKDEQGGVERASLGRRMLAEDEEEWLRTAPDPFVHK